MRRLTCEMCGSTDLVKENGVFVCKVCGCQYSVEEAKKMMIEGTVEVQGTVQVDNSAFVAKYLANARRAKAKEDWEEVEKYYNMVEQNDPDNIEAIFYSAYGKAMVSLTDQDVYKRQAAFKVLKNCISVIDDHYKVERREENKEAIQQMAIDLVKMMSSSFVYTSATNELGVEVRSNAHMTHSMFIDLVLGFLESVNNIEKVDNQPYLHESLIILLEYAKNIPTAKKDAFEKLINEEKEKLEAIKKQRSQEYWAAHQEEYNAYKAELNDIAEKTLRINEDIQRENEKVEILEKEYREKERTYNKNKIRLFLSNDKGSAMKREVEEAKATFDRASTVRNEILAPVREALLKLQTRQAEILTELSRYE